VTRYFYDFEFLEDGRTIEFISVGIVADDGREYYAVSDELTYPRWRPFKGRLARKIRKHDWLMTNVVPSLPKPHGDWNLHMPKSWLFDYMSPVVKPAARIAEQVATFLLEGESEPELWAYYGAYDHVRLNQLWGPMIDHPEGVPMWTNDLMQEWLRLGKPEMPKQPAGLHNALEDARHNKVRFEFLQSVAAGAQ
jgi:hypothetical protein